MRADQLTDLVAYRGEGLAGSPRRSGRPATRVCQLINLTGDTHSIHVHLDPFQDTVRVNPSELFEGAVRFTTYASHYMYHCHILEREDLDMMRPFVTMPAQLMPFMS